MELKYTRQLILESVDVEDTHEFISVVNEGLFDRLGAFFSKILNFFRNPTNLKNSYDRAEEEVTYKSLNSPGIKTGKTIFIKLVDPKKKSEDAYIGFTKLGEYPDKSGIYQFTGSTSSNIISALRGSKNSDELVKDQVLAIFPSTEIKIGQPLEVKFLKNIKKDGSSYRTNSTISSIVKEEDMNIR
jgi:hypothetical protein